MARKNEVGHLAWKKFSRPFGPKNSAIRVGMKRVVYSFSSPRYHPIFTRKMASLNSSPHQQGVVGSSIEQRLKDSFNPLHLEVINESYKHKVCK